MLYRRNTTKPFIGSPESAILLFAGFFAAMFVPEIFIG